MGENIEAIKYQDDNILYYLTILYYINFVTNSSLGYKLFNKFILYMLIKYQDDNILITVLFMKFCIISFLYFKNYI